nr:transporter substrate-binding domain-containing protein [Lysinibacter cavernae]
MLLTGCSSNGDSGDSADAGPLLKEGVFKICSETAYPPFEFKDDSTGEIVGFDIDFANEIAKDLDAKLEIVSSSFESIESGAALDAKNCDAVISGISINDERATKFDFSEPYFDDNLALLVRDDSGITSLDTFEGVVGVQDATTGQAFATEKGLDPKAFEDGTIAVQALESGSVDGVINNIATLAYFAKDNSSLVIADKFGSEPLGAGVRKGNTELLDSINATLKRMDEDGTREAMLAQWMPAIK